MRMSQQGRLTLLTVCVRMWMLMRVRVRARVWMRTVGQRRPEPTKSASLRAMARPLAPFRQVAEGGPRQVQAKCHHVGRTVPAERVQEGE